MATQTLSAKSQPRFAPKGEFWTDEEIMALPDDQGQRYELLDGEIIVISPTGAQHEIIIQRLNFALGNFVEERRLGYIFGGQMGYRLTPLICHAPDISFVVRERLQSIMPDEQKFLTGAPDLAVEVLSPGDSRRETGRKIVHYFDHGAQLAWLIDPRRWQVQVFRSANDVTLMGREDFLNGETLLPGFKYPLSRLFAPALD